MLLTTSSSFSSYDYRENEDGSVLENAKNDNSDDAETEEVEENNAKKATKRKNVQKTGKNKKKKNQRTKAFLTGFLGLSLVQILVIHRPHKRPAFEKEV